MWLAMAQPSSRLNRLKASYAMKRKVRIKGTSHNASHLPPAAPQCKAERRVTAIGLAKLIAR
jgi:hypothetical protein